jgi:phage baseplate assembly protein W
MEWASDSWGARAMADSIGVNAETGAPLTDWEHTQQSITKILTTRVGSRVMRREFGSELLELIDRKMTQRNILAVFGEIALALLRWEPRFRVHRVRVVDLTSTGQANFELYGTYYPRGHLGDYSIMQDASVRVVAEQLV